MHLLFCSCANEALTLLQIYTMREIHWAPYSHRCDLSFNLTFPDGTLLSAMEPFKLAWLQSWGATPILKGFLNFFTISSATCIGICAWSGTHVSQVAPEIVLSFILWHRAASSEVAWMWTRAKDWSSVAWQPIGFWLSFSKLFNLNTRV